MKINDIFNCVIPKWEIVLIGPRGILYIKGKVDSEDGAPCLGEVTDFETCRQSSRKSKLEGNNAATGHPHRALYVYDSGCHNGFIMYIYLQIH